MSSAVYLIAKAVFAVHMVASAPRDTLGYGIIENPDSEDIYFHRNAVKDMAFDDLAEGDSVMYEEEMGEKGLQAV